MCRREQQWSSTTPEWEACIVNQSIESLAEQQLGDTDVLLADCYALEPIASQMIVGMELEALARRSSLEHERYCRNQPPDTRFAYELFRRAIVEHSQEAWNHLYRNYAAQIAFWIKRQRGYADYDASDVLVNETFLRFYQALPPKRFAAFPTLASLLRYLRCCALCAVIDEGRANARAESLQKDASVIEQASSRAFDQEVIARIQAAELWRYIAARVTSEAEQVVLVDDFVLGMKPRAIYHLHRDLFPSVADVYRIKRNLLDRLRRDPPGNREDW
jgi:hypothetical protein